MDPDFLLRLMVGQAADHALILLNEKGIVVAWLMGSQKLFGYDSSEMAGRTIDCLFTPEDRDRQVPAGELQIATRYGSAEDDRWMLRRDGVRFWASGMVNCLRDREGKLAGFCKVLRDRTDMRGQIEALRNRTDALAEEDRRKTVVLGTLAHELRNPLGVLANAASLIDMAYPGDEKLAYALQLLHRQTKFLSAVIQDLLEVVRIRAGKATLQARKVVLNDLIADAVESTSAAIQKKEQRVEVLLPQPSIVLDADFIRLKQVFINLLANASKFSAPGAAIRIEGLTEAEEVVVRVEDPGRGIPADLLPHVFELFSQGVSHDGAAGLGLGLFIVKDYVELHGGTVQARSEGVGRGSEFIVRLPLGGTTV